jgi:general secretion pathway protein K
MNHFKTSPVVRRFFRLQSGAALLSAMLTVTLVATFASAALWQQFRSLEIETAERGRLQSALILTGALDWARLILREDGRTGGADHLAEPWAVPLEEARLSSFLAVDGMATDADRDAFLSGTITDMQSRLNVANLVDGAVKSEVGMASFQRLFELLDLPPQALATLSENYLAAAKRAYQPPNPSDSASAPPPPPSAADASDFLLPQRSDQLAWLGLNADTLAALEPYISVLPARTPVNLNTASALVIAASTPGLDLAGAEKLVAARARKHFSSLAEASQSLGNATVSFTEGQHGVATRFFEVRGQLRLDQLSVFERSLVQRDGRNVRTLWRARGALSETGKVGASALSVTPKP